MSKELNTEEPPSLPPCDPPSRREPFEPRKCWECDTTITDGDFRLCITCGEKRCRTCAGSGSVGGYDEMRGVFYSRRCPALCGDDDDR